MLGFGGGEQVLKLLDFIIFQNRCSGKLLRLDLPDRCGLRMSYNANLCAYLRSPIQCVHNHNKWVQEQLSK